MTLEPIPEQVSESLDLTAVIAMNKQPQFQSNLAKGYLAHLKSKPLVLPLVPGQMLLMQLVRVVGWTPENTQTAGR